MAQLSRENGKNVYYENYGSGSSAVVLIHGWGMSCRTWDYCLPALLAAGHRVISIDHRGCGSSDKDFDDVGIDAIAGDVVALINDLGLEKVVLNGWSLGGAVAVKVASELGAACAGLALTCAATPVYIQKPDYPHGGTEEAMEGTVAGLYADRVNFLSALAKGVCASEVSEDVERWMTEIFLQGSPNAVATIAELGPLDQRAMLGALSVPIVSFVGALDAVVDPNVCRSVPDYNSAAQLVEFSGSGHAPFIEDTENYNSELLTFISSCV